MYVISLGGLLGIFFCGMSYGIILSIELKIFNEFLKNTLYCKHNHICDGKIFTNFALLKLVR